MASAPFVAPPLATLLMQALRNESAARVAGDGAQLAAALAHRRHLNLLLTGGLPIEDFSVIHDAAQAAGSPAAHPDRPATSA
jgi:hypothetical protein